MQETCQGIFPSKVYYLIGFKSTWETILWTLQHWSLLFFCFFFSLSLPPTSLFKRGNTPHHSCVITRCSFSGFRQVSAFCAFALTSTHYNTSAHECIVFLQPSRLVLLRQCWKKEMDLFFQHVRWTRWQWFTACLRKSKKSGDCRLHS